MRRDSVMTGKRGDIVTILHMPMPETTIPLRAVLR
jgi:hypothetical protein